MMSLRNTVFLHLAMAFVAILSLSAKAEVVEYTFDINYQIVNFTGKDVRAMSVGGSIPAPTIEATVGDTLRVTLNNKMDVPSSVHWHGVLLPQSQDGVPFLTMKPIAPGSSFTYEYPVTHHGTYWYHSHTGLQEQRGVYGPIVFHPKQGESVASDHDVVVVLSDWTNENPNRVMHNLKKSDDYYALKKDSVQSWFKVYQHGKDAIKNRINGAWMRMNPMDISDVGYDAFLVNGQKEQHLPQFKAGETVRLRVINAAASSYFYFQFAGGAMKLVSADGVDVSPITVDRQRIAMAETFDVIITMPDDGAYEFRATSEDGTGYSSLYLGEGHQISAPDMPKPNLFVTDHSMHGMHAEKSEHEHHKSMSMRSERTDHRQHDSKEGVQSMKEYELLRSETSTSFDPENPKREVVLQLTGDMERYAWSFNNKVLSEVSKILIKKGETVQLILDNRTMMHHPIHLHGHFFRVLNGNGAYSPLKHTVNVPPMQKVTIEFFANEEKDWFFHCHNLYHMNSGMTRVISYSDTTLATPNSLKPLFSDQNWFYFTDLGIQSNFAHAELRAENTRNAFDLDIEHGVDPDQADDFEVELVYERYVNRFLEIYIGGEVEQETEGLEKNREEIGIVGLGYVLPLLVNADLRLDSDGEIRLELSSELQLTDRFALAWEANTDDEYRVQLEYELNKQAVITGGWDDQYDWGIGLELRY